MESLGVSHPVSPELKNDLEQLVVETKRDNVALVLWITPLHPDLLARIYQVPKATENFEQDTAPTPGDCQQIRTGHQGFNRHQIVRGTFRRLVRLCSL